MVEVIDQLMTEFVRGSSLTVSLSFDLLVWIIIFLSVSFWQIQVCAAKIYAEKVSTELLLLLSHPQPVNCRVTLPSSCVFLFLLQQKEASGKKKDKKKGGKSLHSSSGLRFLGCLEACWRCLVLRSWFALTSTRWSSSVRLLHPLHTPRGSGRRGMLSHLLYHRSPPPRDVWHPHTERERERENCEVGEQRVESWSQKQREREQTGNVLQCFQDFYCPPPIKPPNSLTQQLRCFRQIIWEVKRSV